MRKPPHVEKGARDSARANFERALKSSAAFSGRDEGAKMLQELKR
jgi:hypothetical protein